MRALVAPFLLAAVASLTSAGTAQADTPRLQYFGPGADDGQRLDRPVEPEKAFSNIIYINRCEGGCTITQGVRNNSTTDTSWFPPGPAGTEYTLNEFVHDDATWDAIMACVEDLYMPYNVVITDVDPGNAAHTECYAAGLSEEVGLSSGGVGGAVAPNVSLESACSGGENGVAFAFLNGYSASNIEFMCSVIAQETGHTFGLLDHMMDCTDPMSASYFGPCNFTDRSYFRNRNMGCGDGVDAPCICGGQFVNSHAHLRATFGETGNVQAAPVPVILTPDDGANIDNVTMVGADGTGPRGIFKVEVFMNGWPWGTWTAPDHLAPNQWPQQNYLVPLDSGLPDGVYDLEVRAYDDLGTMGVSEAIEVTKGSPCTSADSCLDGQQCESGKCFWEQPTGALGDACEFDQDCIGPSTYDGQCVTDSTGESHCTVDCNSGALDNCDEGFYCLETNANELTGVCWPDEEGGGCCSTGHESSRQLAGMFGLIALAGLLVFRRRGTR